MSGILWNALIDFRRMIYLKNFVFGHPSLISVLEIKYENLLKRQKAFSYMDFSQAR